MTHRIPKGFKRVPSWIFHPVLPMKGETRVLLAYLICNKSASRMTVDNLRHALGMDEKTVREQLHKLERLGVVKVIRRAK